MKRPMFLIIVFSLAFAQLSIAQQKYALVIGNANYTGITSLNNPLNDAGDMEEVLKNMGFAVNKILNGSRETIEAAVIQLGRQLSGNSSSYGFFFYAGHGVQSRGENYLIPIGANIPSENALRDRAVPLQWVMEELNDAGNELNIIVLDSCRDNPFSWNRSSSRGLAPVTRAPPGSIIFYATSDGQPAADGIGRNGLFTTQLLSNLQTPELEVTEVLRRTGAAVSQASGGIQIPAIYNQFFGKAYLGSSSMETISAPISTASGSEAVPVFASPGFAYINGGTFIMGSPGNEKGRYDGEGPQYPVTIGSFHIGRYEITQKEYQEVMGKNPSHFKGDYLPVENVSWFDAIEYCNRRSRMEGLVPAYTITGSGNNRSVTWNRNANGYRLPTEAEWEYACRAGTVTPFNTGNNINTSQANYNGNYPYGDNVGGMYRELTTPVGSFPANLWYLHDMHGNVWEWCWDWYAPYYSGARTDPAGPVSGSRRALRGGSWDSTGAGLRSAFRDGTAPNRVSDSIGFRIVHP